MSQEWFFVKNGKEIGPISTTQLKQMVVNETIVPTSLIRRGDLKKPLEASKIKGLFSSKDDKKLKNTVEDLKQENEISANQEKKWYKNKYILLSGAGFLLLVIVSNISKNNEQDGLKDLKKIQLPNEPLVSEGNGINQRAPDNSIGSLPVMNQAIEKEPRIMGTEDEFKAFLNSLPKSSFNAIHPDRWIIDSDYSSYVNRERVYNLNLIESHLEILAKFDKVKTIVYDYNIGINDRIMERIGSIKSLESVIIRTQGDANNVLQDEYLKHLVGLSQLKVLEFPNFSEKNIMYLGKMTQLEDLEYTNRKIQPKLVETISSLNNLKKLNLTSSEFLDSADSLLGELRAIEDLKLEGSNISDIGVKALSKANSLKVLDISSTPVSDNGAVNLQNLTNLRKIKAKKTKITDTFVVSINRLSNLVVLDLADCKLTNKSVEYLFLLKNIKDLNLEGTQVDSNALDLFSKFNHLSVLNLLSTRLSSADMEFLRKSLPNCIIMESGKVTDKNALKLADEIERILRK
jgi:hypothetical protein